MTGQWNWGLLVLLLPVLIIALEGIDLQFLQHWWSIEVEQLILDSLCKSSVELTV